MKKKISFLPLEKINSKYKKNFINELNSLFDNGKFIRGNPVEMFESEFANFAKVPYCLGVGNGYDSLVLILKSLKEMNKLEDNNYVLVPSISFIASANAVIAAGMKPIFCEVDNEDYIIDPDQIPIEFLEKASALLWVHLYGKVKGLKKIKKLCNEFDLILIEDCAQSHGATEMGKTAGSIGFASGFSFYPGKNLGALGDAGAVTTYSKDLFEVVKSLSNYGSTKKYLHEYIGINSRLDTIQAIFLRLKLKQIHKIISKRKKIANIYLNNIKNPLIKLPKDVRHEDVHSWHLFVITTNVRDEIQRFLVDKGIHTLIHYPELIPHQPCFKGKFQEAPNLKKHGKKLLSLPINEYMTEDDANLICRLINQFKL